MQACGGCRKPVPLEAAQCPRCDTVLLRGHAVCGDRTSLVLPTWPAAEELPPTTWAPIPPPAPRPELPCEWLRYSKHGWKARVHVDDRYFDLFVHRWAWRVAQMVQIDGQWMHVELARGQHTDSEQARTTCRKALEELLNPTS